MKKYHRFIVGFVLGFALAGGYVYADVKGFVHSNVYTDFNKSVDTPNIDRTAHVHEDATVIGHVYIGKRVFLAPHSFVRGDEGQPLFVGDESNIQDAAGIHALEAEELHNGHWQDMKNRRFSRDGRWLDSHESKNGYAVYIGKRVSIAHQSLVHGPAWVGNDTFIGMQSQIFNAKVGNNVAIGVKSLITGGVSIPDGSYIAPGSVITKQSQADALPQRIGSPYEKTNKAVVHVNTSLADGYNGKTGPAGSIKSHQESSSSGSHTQSSAHKSSQHN